MDLGDHLLMIMYPTNIVSSSDDYIHMLIFFFVLLSLLLKIIFLFTCYFQSQTQRDEQFYVLYNVVIDATHFSVIFNLVEDYRKSITIL